MIRALALFVVLAVAIAAVAFGAFMVLFMSSSWFGVDVFWYEHAQTAAAAATALAMAVCGWRIAWDETVKATRVRY